MTDYWLRIRFRLWQTTKNYRQTEQFEEQFLLSFESGNFIRTKSISVLNLICYTFVRSFSTVQILRLSRMVRLLFSNNKYEIHCLPIWLHIFIDIALNGVGFFLNPLKNDCFSWVNLLCDVDVHQYGIDCSKHTNLCANTRIHHSFHVFFHPFHGYFVAIHK